MTILRLDLCGLRCPQPIFKIALTSADLSPGDILDVTADCASFEMDVRTWCRRLKKTLLFVRDEGEYRKTVRIAF